MRQWIRGHLTFANVASAIALFVALGGGTAVALNGTNTVQSDDLGPGAQVKAADVADNAVNGADVVNDSLGGADVNESALAKVPNADKLDGQDSAAFQRRVSGSCANHRAISAIAANGSVICEGAVIPFDLSSPNGDHREVRVGDLGISTTCAEGTSFKRVFFINDGNVGGTLNWLYGDGTTVFADGVAMGSSTDRGFSFAGKRLEGQFIFSLPTQKTTVNLHAFDAGSSGCEVHGTVTYAPTS